MYGMAEHLLALPIENMLEDTFQIIMRVVSGDLDSLEGCYLYLGKKKRKWTRSGETAGVGDKSCFYGRVSKHRDNAKALDQMREHPIYRDYPAKEVPNLCACNGYFGNFVIYRGMVFDKSNDVAPLCLD